ncbi:3-alpha-(or 20-beta)-hydroxysteroid dehydrogenase [Ophiocordyceps camponoti-floridani]|uniref:3-alpha-(Or 20-beta)-hydroxysteroid dehydrogenase n=1 Tax=Ophiocordyceps camponoti-floridani TaxID=2030778 RepID=A0A8H4VCK9_9HYPO|nr:3-alpha-(or 20-beta)-hydroxysteroid dehydrogenase [Ophiocordyceps camponoti-floridani]
MNTKVIIITGANSPKGIGRAAAHHFAPTARALYLCDLETSSLEAAQAEGEMRSAFPGVDDVRVCRFDAASEEHVRAVVDDAVGRFGRLDVFFANAGVAGGGDDDEVSAEGFMDVLRVNALSVYLAAKHATPAMRKTSAAKPHPQGTIIATASVAGLRSGAGPPAYSASKAAIISLVQTLSYRLTGTGVRINAVCPGLIETGMTAPLYEAARARGSEGRIESSSFWLRAVVM